ncbi:hypothetical protein [Mammaliicoccus sp. P-M59]|uniref:hypothetical protein n=1 Tax=Mammaliicoccus sp. P-M59 TaxID=2898718 RepID=UPI001EFB44B8|nr:hypothetical protein [Mammaliicoccus sp. P-M59]
MDRLEKLYQDVYNKVDKMNNQFLKLQSHTKHTKELYYTHLDYRELEKYIENNNIDIRRKYSFLNYELSILENEITDLKVNVLSQKICLIEYEYRYNDLNIYSMKNDANIFDTIGFNGNPSNIEIIYKTPFKQLQDKLFDKDINFTSDEINYLIHDIECEIEDMENTLIEYYRYIRSVRKADRMIDDMLKNQISRFERYYQDYQEFQKNNSQI